MSDVKGTAIVLVLSLCFIHAKKFRDPVSGIAVDDPEGDLVTGSGHKQVTDKPEEEQKEWIKDFVDQNAQTDEDKDRFREFMEHLDVSHPTQDRK